MLKHSKIHCLITENRICSTFNDTPYAPEAATTAKIRKKKEGFWYFPTLQKFCLNKKQWGAVSNNAYNFQNVILDRL